MGGRVFACEASRDRCMHCGLRRKPSISKILDASNARTSSACTLAPPVLAHLLKHTRPGLDPGVFGIGIDLSPPLPTHTPAPQTLRFLPAENRFCSGVMVLPSGMPIFPGGFGPTGLLKDGRANIGVRGAVGVGVGLCVSERNTDTCVRACVHYCAVTGAREGADV